MQKYTKKTRMRSLKKRRGKTTKRKKSKTKINYLTTIIKVLDNTPMDEETMARYKLIKNYALRHPKKINKMISKLLKKQFKHAKPALETASSNSSESIVSGGGKGKRRVIQQDWRYARKKAMKLARKQSRLASKRMTIDAARDKTCPYEAQKLIPLAGYDPKGCRKFFNKGKDKLEKQHKKQASNQHRLTVFDRSDLKHLDKPPIVQIKPSEKLSYINYSKLQPYDNRNMFQPKTVELVGAPSLIGQRDIKQYLINHPIDIRNCTQLVNKTTGNIIYQCKNLEGEADILMKNFRAPLGIENSHTPPNLPAYGSALMLLQLFLAFGTRKLRSARKKRYKKEQQKKARERRILKKARQIFQGDSENNTNTNNNSYNSDNNDSNNNNNNNENVNIIIKRLAKNSRKTSNKKSRRGPHPLAPTHSTTQNKTKKGPHLLALTGSKTKRGPHPLAVAFAKSKKNHDKKGTHPLELKKNKEPTEEELVAELLHKNPSLSNESRLPPPENFK